MPFENIISIIYKGRAFFMAKKKKSLKISFLKMEFPGKNRFLMESNEYAINPRNQELAILVIGLLLALVPIGVFLTIVYKQSRNLLLKTSRSTILSTRCAITTLPSYIIFMFITLVVPMAYYVMLIPVAIMEGLSFYVFFALVVENMKGNRNITKFLF